MQQSKRKWLVVGGGISGLAAAQCLQADGSDYMLLEQCPSLGGLTRTVKVADFCFDYTGHFLHLSRYKTPANIPYAHLADDEWQTVERRSYFFVGGKFITAPIQYHLGELPRDVLRECIESYENRPKIQTDSITFHDYIVSGFGRAVADRFLIPQNEKTMATSLDRLSISAVKRFFPPPHEERIRQGFAHEVVSTAEYNSNFWYPKKGGIDLLVKGLSSGLTKAVVNEKVATIDLGTQTLMTSTGNKYSWDVMLSCIPLKTLCFLTREQELVDMAQHLTHSTTISFNIGLRGALPRMLQKAHWVYIPDRSIPFYRFGCYSNISKGTCSSGYNAIYVEVAVPGEDVDRVDFVNKLQPKVIESLEKLGWIRSKDIVCSVTHVIRCAYVHHTPERERSINRIFDRLREFGVHPIGRYGLWDYTSMEDSIESAISTVKGLL